MKRAIFIFLHATWALPMNLVGLAFFWGSKRLKTLDTHAIYFGGPVAQAFFRASGMGAITLGWFVFSRFSVIRQDIERHEARHVWQQLVLGWLFPFAYYLPMPFLLLTGKDPYFDNPLEADARGHER